MIMKMRMRRKRATFSIMALCGAMDATSVQRSVWMWGWSEEWWDRDVNGFTETDFI